jgi:hypothetical protein
MNYASRIKQVEKKAGRGNGRVHIEVSLCEDNETFDEEYAVHRARQVLRLVSLDERSIFVCGPETEARYDDMTPEQAKKILSRQLTTGK